MRQPRWQPAGAAQAPVRANATGMAMVSPIVSATAVPSPARRSTAWAAPRWGEQAVRTQQVRAPGVLRLLGPVLRNCPRLSCRCVHSPTPSPTDPVPRGLLTLCPGPALAHRAYIQPIYCLYTAYVLPIYSACTHYSACACACACAWLLWQGGGGGGGVGGSCGCCVGPQEAFDVMMLPVLGVTYKA